MNTKDAQKYATSSAVLEKELESIRESGESDKRVLVVDDEESLAGALSEFLAMRGYEVSTAVNPRQALALIHEKPFNVVVSDLRLPGMNGVELLEHVMEVDPHTVVIIMTGYASVQSAVDALKKGAYDYVVKPFSVHELEQTLRLGLERRKLSKENLELSHLMRKLVEIDQMKSDIISSVSHEFRTPLMSLKGYLSMLNQFSGTGAAIGTSEKKWLQAMKDNLGRLEMLILNLLLTTEGNTGGLIIADDDLSVTELVKEAVSRLDVLARSKEVEVVVKAASPARLRGDAEKLEVALGNLVENAIKFNLDSGSVEISVADTTSPDGVRVAVADTGVGMPEGRTSAMFDCFTQSDMTRTRRFNGAGLGLPVARMVVEAHGGRIDVESRPGKGSTFFVWLPRRSEG